MANNATININAVDNTRGAFLAVQRNLNQVKKTAEDTGKGLMNSLSGRGLGTALGAALGINLRNISESIARTITGVTKESEEALNRLVAATAQIANITEQRMRARRTDEQQIALLQQREESRLRQMAELQQRINTVGNQGAIEASARRLGSMVGITNEMESQDVLAAKMAGLNLEMNQIIAEREGLERRVSAAAESTREKFEEAMRAAGTRSAPLKLTEQIDAVREAQGRLMADLAKIDVKTKEGMEAAIPLLKEMARLNADLETLEDRRLRVARDASKIMAEGFEEAVFSGKKLSDVIKQLGQDIMRLVFRNMITTPLANALTSGFGRILGFAGGGIPPTGRASIVGEKGPELFVPGTSGRIVPNNELAKESSGNGSTYYIDARGADQTGLARLEGLIRQTQASIKPIALGAVMDARMRGGALA